MSSEHSRGIYKSVVSPLLDRAGHSEEFHIAARELLHIAESNPVTLRALDFFADQHKRFRDLRLQVLVGGVYFENPLIVGAGWDKKGKAVKALYELGFAGVEVGSVLAYPQPGNDKPRQWMVGDGVSLNRLGFNSPGVIEVKRNLAKYDGSIPIGISIGKNKNVPESEAAEAHSKVLRMLYDEGDYFVINVSSPNTPGLRALQDKKPLTDIVHAVNDSMDMMGGKKPLFVKIAPDLTDTAVDDVIEVVIDNELTGIIATNTTINEGIKTKYGIAGQAGGLAGNDEDYRSMATEKVKYIYREVGDKIAIIGVGGIKDAATAIERMRAGATLLQVVTAIRGEGTAVAGKINRGIASYMTKEGLKSISEFVGADVK